MMVTEYVHTPIIGIYGVAQSGKDTIATILHDVYGFGRLSYAGVLREALYVLNPYVPGPSLYHRYADMIDSVGYEKAKQNPEVRRLLQVMGTEVGRNLLDDNVWVTAAFRNAPSGLVVIPDMRFPNEYNAVVQRGGRVWRVIRPGYEAANDHISDRALDGYPFDHTFINDGTVADLTDKIMEILG